MITVLFWICSIEGTKEGSVVFGIVFCLICVAVKKKMGIAEDDLITALKGFFCGPCLIGQLASTAESAEAREHYMPLDV